MAGLLFASLLCVTPVAWAVGPDITPLSVDGGLDSCTVSTADYNSGGTISVHGISIQVPKNLIAQFPTTWVPFKQFCDAKLNNYEVSVLGNFVKCTAIAAQISVGSPFLAEASMGYIQSVDIADGSFQTIGGPKVRLNDPNAVFSKGFVPGDLFPVDDENPSVSAFSGFPMCIPRNTSDPTCPSTNRPAGGQRNFEAKDPVAMVPFIAGDYIEYSGIWDKTKSEVWAKSVVAINVQVTTASSATVPNYIRVEDAIIGVFDPDANVEVADGRFIGYLSDCNGATVSISAIDVDPCTGKESYRQIGSAIPKAGDVRCKWEFRYDTTTASVTTREYLIKANNPVITTKNGIQAGRYVMPVSEWIQPEVAVPGADPPPYRFDKIRGLVEGDFLDGRQYGPLSPFPGPAPPAPSKTCSPADIPVSSSSAAPSATPTGPSPDLPNPTASAAPIAAVQRAGTQFTLVASNTAKGLTDADLVYDWTQTSPSSPIATIDSSSAPTATVTAPQVSKDTTFTFTIKISLKSDPTKSSTATVSVKVSPSGADVVTLDAYTWTSKQSGTISVSCHTNVVDGSSKQMFLVINGNTATKISMSTGDGPGKWVYESRGVKKPTTVQCQSPLGGSSKTVSATTAKKRRRGSKRRV